MRNLGKENSNEEDEEYSETTPEINDSIKSKFSTVIAEKDVRISLLAKTIAVTLIKAVILSIYTYEQDILEVGDENKKVQNRDRWNHCCHMPIQSLLGNNHHLPCFHMAKRFI